MLAAPQHDYARALIGAVPVDCRYDRMQPAPSPRRPLPRDVGAARRAAAQGELLRVENLVVEYRTGLLGRRTAFRAVDGVSFSVQAGEIFGLIGESGCGKTTVANCVAGLMKPTAGHAGRRQQAVAGWSSRTPTRP